jgi:hypothetical protein
MVYCKGVMFFHKLVDCTDHSQDANYVFGVTIILLRHFFGTTSMPYAYVFACVFIGDRKSDH